MWRSGLEEGANVVSGAPSIPRPPAFLRPLLRLFLFNRILKKDAFPKGFRAHKAMNPTSGPATPAQARVRLDGALARFDQECRRRVASGQHVVSTGFGTVSVEDLVRFSAAHSPPLQTDARRSLKTARLQGEPANHRLQPSGVRYLHGPPPLKRGRYAVCVE
jgi:hypothetical protein